MGSVGILHRRLFSAPEDSGVAGGGHGGQRLARGPRHCPGSCKYPSLLPTLTRCYTITRQGQGVESFIEARELWGVLATAASR